MSGPETWMPFFVVRYLHDTRLLNPAQHGAYLLLLMHYWLHGPLEDDDEALAAIIGVDCKTWQKQMAAKVRRFFSQRDGFLFQKRMEIERARAADISAKRRAAAIASHNRPPSGGGGNGADPPKSNGAFAPAFAPANAEKQSAFAPAQAVSKDANASPHLYTLPSIKDSLGEESRAREPASTEPTVGSEASQAIVLATKKAFRNNWPPRKQERNRWEQIEAVAPHKPAPKYLTPEQLALLRKRA